MGLFDFVENFFLVSLGITFALIILLVYHFKQRISSMERKGDTMYELITNIVKEMHIMKNLNSYYESLFNGTGNQCESLPNLSNKHPSPEVSAGKATCPYPHATIQKTISEEHPSKIEITLDQRNTKILVSDDSDSVDGSDEEDGDEDIESDSDVDSGSDINSHSSESDTDSEDEYEEVQLPTIADLVVETIPEQTLRVDVGDFLRETLDEELLSNVNIVNIDITDYAAETITEQSIGVETPEEYRMEDTQTPLISDESVLTDVIYSTETVSVPTPNEHIEVSYSEPDSNHLSENVEGVSPEPEPETETKPEPETNHLSENVEGVSPEPEPEPETEKKNTREVYRKMNITQLRALVTSFGISADTSKMKKNDIITLLENLEE
jgi:hypothetical protein